MNIQNLFEQFYGNIKITPVQREDAEKKYNGVCECVHDHYYPGIKYSGKTKLLIGSYGKHTEIRPPRDVDVLFFMPPDKFEQYRDNESNGQSQLLQDIRAILQDTYTTTEEIRTWGKVIQIQFTEGKHNIELLPAWELENGSFTIPNTKDGGHWENWNPRQEIKRINDSDENTQGKTRALIRMVKKWMENCTANLKSFQIEKGVVDFLHAYRCDDKNYSVLVKDFFNYFKDHVTESKSHLETAFNRANNACDFENKGELVKATEEWKKIFGTDFPSIKVEISQSLKEVKPNLADYSHCDHLRWTHQNLYRVNIDGYVYSENKEIQLGGIGSDGRNLSKGLELKFVATTNTPGLFYYYWQVVNTGEEARLAGGLRGSIFSGEKTRWESTLYHGKHWVECFIVQNNICVARSGRFFVNIR